MDELKALYKRLREDAEFGTDEWDMLIHIAFGKCIHPREHRVKHETMNDDGSVYDKWTSCAVCGRDELDPIPAYSRSLEVAIKYIPKGWYMKSLEDCRHKEGGWFFSMFTVDDEHCLSGRGATPGLAICSCLVNKVTHHDPMFGSGDNV